MLKNSKEVTKKAHLSQLKEIQTYTNQLESCLIVHHTLIYFLLQGSDLPWGPQISQGICESNSDIYDLFNEMQSTLNSVVFELKNSV
ncbi:MAG: hypothetical protein WEA58_04065 [Balneolaceae bacterium]